jgi:hypothetical protein
VTKTFQKNNKVRTIVSNLFVFAHSDQDRFWLTKEECRLLEEFLAQHRGFFGLPPTEEEQGGRQREDS